MREVSVDLLKNGDVYCYKENPGRRYQVVDAAAKEVICLRYGFSSWYQTGSRWVLSEAELDVLTAAGVRTGR